MGIFRLLNKDVKFQNENRQCIVTLRLLYIIQFLALTVNMVLTGSSLFDGSVFTLPGFLAAIVVLFSLTYCMKTGVALISYLIFTFLWIPSLITCFGWSAGIQDYYLIVLMLCFFANIGTITFKFALAALVFLARTFTIALFSGIPGSGIDDFVIKPVNMVNNAAVFLSIIVISFIFSYRKNEADSKLMKYNDMLMKEANTDQLTGLYNRRRAVYILDDLKQAAYLESISVVMADIDFFKKVNDTYGHDAGDEVLKFISRTMQDNCGRDALIIRWGGEEFLMVFGGKNGDETYPVIEKLRKTIMATPINVKGTEIKVTMTFGIAEYDFSGDLHNTVKEADSKLYMGKEDGRNRVVY